jgi:hypothetical protein
MSLALMGHEFYLFTDVDEQAFATIQNSDNELSCLCTKIYDPNNICQASQWSPVFVA